MAGITLDAEGLDGNTQTVGLLYYSFSVVTDNKGNIQFYITTLDQEFIEGSESPTQMGGYKTVDPLGEEIGDKDSAYGLGLSLGWGMIDGNKFSSEGTSAFAGKARDYFGGVGDVSVDAYAGLDENGNLATDLVGLDVAGSVGVPLSMGTVITNSVAINEDPFRIPARFIPVCQAVSMCGSSTIPGSQFP
jgi:hypothetical protein